ncbi:hypothetical protein D3C72_2326870 [compost metagenome]
MDDGLLAAAAVVKYRLIDVASGDADLLAVLHVGNGTAAHRLFDGFLDVLAVTPQEALAVNRALVLAVQTSVDHMAHGAPPGSCKPQATSCKSGSVQNLLLAA